MSPLRRPVIIDNDVISKLFQAGVLKRVLSVWPRGSFYVPERVKEEASQWPTRGAELVTILEELEKKGIVTITSIDDTSEEEIAVYTVLRLGKRLGKGESASIAIAYSRGLDVATDDGNAREACKEMYPDIKIIGSGTIINWVVRDGLISADEANQMRKSVAQYFI